MLEEKIEQASLASRKRGKRSLVVIGALLLSIGVAAALIPDFNVPSKQVGREQAPPVQYDNAVSSSEFREQFLQQLQRYETEVEPELAAANLNGWNQQAEAELFSLKDEAVTLFSGGNYAAALKLLSKLETAAGALLAERERLFASELSLAREALRDDDYNRAKLHISKALQLKPDDQQAVETESRIESLPEVLALIKRGDVAAVENNPEKEHAAIAKAFELAPYRPTLKERRDDLAERIRQERFSKLMDHGFSSVERRANTDARRSYAEAKALYPDRSELKLLHDAISRVAAELDLEQVKTMAERAIGNDQWQQAEQIYAAAITRHPDDKVIRDGLQLAGRLVELQQHLDGYINRPARLASANVLAAAKNELIHADLLATYSRSLRQKRDRLKAVIAEMSQAVPVLVKSDNRTFIVVRGVGKVGVTHAREISLKPGPYTFEGTREGYRSKLVELQLPAGASSIEVEVVCDERI